MKASPGKAAVLALLLAVAMYYWAPLAWKWLGPRDSAEDMLAKAAEPSGFAPAAAGPGAVAGTAQASAGTGMADQGAAPSHPWQQIVQWMEQDPRMRPAEELVGRRDPFQAVAAAAADEEDQEKEQSSEAKAAAALAAMTPDQLGAELTSTLIGPQRRLALVNGRPYRQGRTIVLSKDGQRAEFHLSEVHARRIVLERDGVRYELTIPQSDPAGRLEVTAKDP